jgi:hypothetical protein
LFFCLDEKRVLTGGVQERARMTHARRGVERGVADREEDLYARVGESSQRPSRVSSSSVRVFEFEQQYEYEYEYEHACAGNGKPT